LRRGIWKIKKKVGGWGCWGGGGGGWVLLELTDALRLNNLCGIHHYFISDLTKKKLKIWK